MITDGYAGPAEAGRHVPGRSGCLPAHSSGEAGPHSAHCDPNPTSSKNAAPVVVVLWLVNASPTKYSNVRSTATDPTCVHVTKSLDTNDVNVFPVRVRRTHRGATPASDAVV